MFVSRTYKKPDPQKARKAGKLFLTKLQTFFGSVKYVRWLKEMMKVGLQESVIAYSTRAINL